jgi:hypothetical protein
MRKKTGIIILCIFFVILFLKLANAPVPEPHGIAGYVHNNNSNVQVPAGTSFKVNETVTSDLVQDVTGIGPFSGRYSVVVSGNDGDEVIITAWNFTHYGRLNITLRGDMDNINLSLNMTRPSELNITIKFPQNNSLFNISSAFNITVNITAMGGSGISCNATLFIEKANILILSAGETLIHELGSISSGNTIQTNWSIIANYTGRTNISVWGICQNSGENFDNLNDPKASNITVQDTVAPGIILYSPANNTMNNTHSTILFFYNVTDDSNILNCSLVLNGVKNISNSTISKNKIMNFSQLIPNGNYNWSINCTDDSLNEGASEIRNLTVNVIILAISNLKITSPVNLQAASTTEIFCNATINGADKVNATLFHESAKPYDSDDNNVHYSNSSCELGSEYFCSFNVLYYANSGTWYCNITAEDIQGTILSDNISTIVNPLVAIEISPDVVDYGSLVPGDVSAFITVNISNMGNVPLDLNMYGYGDHLDDNLSMNCTVGVISINYTRFALNTSIAYADMTNLSGVMQSPSYVNISLPKQNSSVIVKNYTYWKLQAPPGLARNCTGSLVFGAIIDS